MNDIFYNIDKLSLTDLKLLYNNALMASYNSRVEKLEEWYREIDSENTIKNALNSISTTNYNIFVLRQMTSDSYYEIVYRKAKKDKDEFLYIFCSIEEGGKLIEKFNLEIRK